MTTAVGTSVFHRDPRHRYPQAMRGEGAYLVDTAGRRYLDASGGAAVSCLGHSDATVVEAICTQLRTLPFAHTSFFSSGPAEELAERLAAAAPGALDHVYFVSGGSEAIEAALKLARQYMVEQGEFERVRFIARRQSYHGNTLGALSIGSNPGRRTLYEPILLDSGHISHVAPCYAYRDRHSSEIDYGTRLAAELDAEIRRLEPKTVIAFIAETVSGATLGAATPVAGYLKQVREVCDRHGALLILDEVMCGMGRTGTLFAYEQDGMAPDIVAIAKGLGAGYQPIGVMIVSAPIFEAVRVGSGFFQHGHTYLGHIAACAGALAVQTAIEELGLLQRVRRLGAGLVERLNTALGDHAHVGDIRGRGLFLGVEFVADQNGKRPFDPELRFAPRLKANALAEGLICYPSSGTVDGTRGDHVLLAPPYILDEAQLDELVDKLVRAIDRTVADVRRS